MEHLWSQFSTYHLTENMRLIGRGEDERQFAHSEGLAARADHAQARAVQRALATVACGVPEVTPTTESDGKRQMLNIMFRTV